MVMVLLLCVVIPTSLNAAKEYYITQTNEYKLPVRLSGGEEITIEYGKPYEDSGATAEFYGTKLHTEKVSVETITEGFVNTEKLGTYELRYIARYDNFVGTAYRLVRVVDRTAPVITLTSDPNHYTIPGQPYQEEGFEAVDGYDGDLTDRVERVEIDGVVTYTVSDFSGNTATVTREIVYADPVAPKITLNGNSQIYIFQGVPFKDPGCTASDNLDGDISQLVTCQGTVDHSTAGTYFLTYAVLDSAGNSASASRTVTVVPIPEEPENEEEAQAPTVPQPLPDYIEPNGKTICLTFDDGPGPYTDQLLDILKKYNVKATFFVVNTGYIDTIQRAAEEGHTVAIHTKTHNFHAIYASEDAFFEDFDFMADKILTLTGKEPVMMRFPGGSSNTISRFNKGIITRLSALLKERGFRIFDWNVDSNDAGGAKTPEEVYNNVIRGVQKRNYSVVLQHDIKGFSVDAVERIIIWGLANGYTFEALTENSPACEHNIAN